MKGMYLVPFKATVLTGEIGLEALLAPIPSRRWGRKAPSDAIAALLGFHEISLTTPPREFIEVGLAMNRHPCNVWAFLYKVIRGGIELMVTKLTETMLRVFFGFNVACGPISSMTCDSTAIWYQSPSGSRAKVESSGGSQKDILSQESVAGWGALSTGRECTVSRSSRA